MLDVICWSPTEIMTSATVPGCRRGLGQIRYRSTFGAGDPFTGHNTIGHAIEWNVTNQYHVARYIWPEFDNSTVYDGGKHDGMKQVFLTPGWS